MEEDAPPDLSNHDDDLDVRSCSLPLSHSQFRTQNVPQEILFFIQNQYSAIARNRSNTTAIIVIVKI